MIELHFPQILAAMQKELAASGLSPEEILAKTLLLQVTFLLLLLQVLFFVVIVVVAPGNFFVVVVPGNLRTTLCNCDDNISCFNNDYHQKCLAGDNSPAFINKTLKNALNVANISPEDLAKVIFVRTLIIRSVLDSFSFDTVYNCSVSDKIDFSWQ